MKFRVRLPKQFIFAAYCVVRQAERSIRPALCPGHWRFLQHYYADHYLQTAGQVLADLQAVLPKQSRRCEASNFSSVSIRWLLLRPITYIANRYRKWWFFSTEELHFVANTLARFVELLAANTECQPDEASKLAVDLYVCVWIIERRIEGSRELPIASRIEHYCPSPHQLCVTLDDVLQLVS